MKKRILLPIILVVLIIVITICTIFYITNKNSEEKLINEIKVNDTNISEEEKVQINELKQETGKTGDTEFYEIQESYDNIKIATIKPSIKYKVAFAGMIKNNKPEKSELDNIITEQHPKYAGIWIYEKDREKVMEYLSNVTESKYKIDDNGYLRIENKDRQNSNDKKIEKAIKGKKLYIIKVSSLCYIVDEITSEILDYTFEDLDPYQTYEYFQDGDKEIIFMTENKNNQLEINEIIQSIIDLL